MVSFGSMVCDVFVVRYLISEICAKILLKSYLDDGVEAQLSPGKHHDDNDQRSPAGVFNNQSVLASPSCRPPEVLQILLIAGQCPEVGVEAQAEHGEADHQGRAEEQGPPRELQQRSGGEERDEEPEGGDSEGGEVFVHRAPGLLEDGDDVEGHHGETRAAVEDVEGLGDHERFEESPAGEKPQFAPDLLPEGLPPDLPLPVLPELLQLLLSLAVAPQPGQGPLSLLQSVLLSQPVGSLGDLAQT